MTDTPSHDLRDIDKTVLQYIADGCTDTHEISQATTLETHQIRYSLKKLDDQDLITTKNPDGMTERTVNGQKRVFKTPLQAKLTDHGTQLLKEDLPHSEEQYHSLSRDELTEKLHDHEQRIQRLETGLEILKDQL